MLDEIRSFFDEQRGPPPKWPEHLPAISPATGEDLPAESESHWRLAMQYLDEIEAAIIRLYEDGADHPMAIDLLDGVIATIRRKGESYEVRLKEIGRLLPKG
jgi:hypothetical protein